MAPEQQQAMRAVLLEMWKEQQKNYDQAIKENVGENIPQVVPKEVACYTEKPTSLNIKAMYTFLGKDLLKLNNCLKEFKAKI